MKKPNLRKGQFNANALKTELEIQPNKLLHDRSLQRLNFLIGFVKTNKQDMAEEYFKKLMTTFQDLTKEDYISEEEIDQKVDNKLNHLHSYPKLAKSAINYFLQTLIISNDGDWFSNKFKITEGANLRSFLYHGYYCLSAMIETFGREEAIKLHKRFVTHNLIDKKVENRNFTTVEKHYEKVAKSINEPSNWVIVFGLLSDGKYFYRNDNCLWIDAMEELPDNEIKYHVCCYGDYQGAKEYYDENVLLTMEHTIAQGDAYCSRVLHDTRVDWDLKHPAKEFWDNIVFD